MTKIHRTLKSRYIPHNLWHCFSVILPSIFFGLPSVKVTTWVSRYTQNKGIFDKSNLHNWHWSETPNPSPGISSSPAKPTSSPPNPLLRRSQPLQQNFLLFAPTKPNLSCENMNIIILKKQQKYQSHENLL